MKYRKKPVVIEAVQWDGSDESYESICALATGQLVEAARPGVLAIPTLEGTMEAGLGDFVIRGVKGEIYPCKPDIFAATYEAADDPRPLATLTRGSRVAYDRFGSTFDAVVIDTNGGGEPYVIAYYAGGEYHVEDYVAGKDLEVQP